MDVAIETKNRVIEITLGIGVGDSSIPIAIDAVRTLYDKGFDCIDKCYIRGMWMSTTKEVQISLYIRQNMCEIIVTMLEDFSKLIKVSVYPDNRTTESSVRQTNALEFLIKHKLVDKKLFFNLDFVEFI